MPPQINLVDPDSYQRAGPPHEQFAWLREHDPVHWHADGGGPGWPGFWAVTRHRDIERAGPAPVELRQRDQAHAGAFLRLFSGQF